MQYEQEDPHFNMESINRHIEMFLKNHKEFDPELKPFESFILKTMENRDKDIIAAFKKYEDLYAAMSDFDQKRNYKETPAKQKGDFEFIKKMANAELELTKTVEKKMIKAGLKNFDDLNVHNVSVCMRGVLEPWIEGLQATPEKYVEMSRKLYIAIYNSDHPENPKKINDPLNAKSLHPDGSHPHHSFIAPQFPAVKQDSTTKSDSTIQR